MTEDKLDGRFRFYETGVFHTIEPLKMAAALAAVLLTGIILLCCFLTAMDNYQNSIVDELQSAYSQVGDIFVSSIATPVITVIWIILTFFIGFIVASALFDRKWKYIATEDNITFSSKRKTVIYKYENVASVNFRDYKLLHKVIGLIVTVDIETRKDTFKYVYPDSMIPKNEMNTPFAIINKKKLEKLKMKRALSENTCDKATEIKAGQISCTSAPDCEVMESISADDIKDYVPSNMATDENRSHFFTVSEKSAEAAAICQPNAEAEHEITDNDGTLNGEFDYNSLLD